MASHRETQTRRKVVPHQSSWAPALPAIVPLVEARRTFVPYPQAWRPSSVRDPHVDGISQLRLGAPWLHPAEFARSTQREPGQAFFASSPPDTDRKERTRQSERCRWSWRSVVGLQIPPGSIFPNPRRDTDNLRKDNPSIWRRPGARL